MHIIEAKPLSGHRLFLRFQDGKKGEVDLSTVKFKGVFAPLKDLHYFSKVTIDRECGTVCWPNGADMDPYVLYSEATGVPLPRWEETGKHATEKAGGKFSVERFVREIHRLQLRPQLVKIALEGGLPAYECGGRGKSFRLVMNSIDKNWSRLPASRINTAKQVWGKAVAVVLLGWGFVSKAEEPTELRNSKDPGDIKNARSYRRIRSHT